jgi:hypothetical protein
MLIKKLNGRFGLITSVTATPLDFGQVLVSYMVFCHTQYVNMVIQQVLNLLYIYIYDSLNLFADQSIHDLLLKKKIILIAYQDYFYNATQDDISKELVK